MYVLMLMYSYDFLKIMSSEYIDFDMLVLHMAIILEEISGQIAPSWSHKVITFSTVLSLLLFYFLVRATLYFSG